MQRAHREVAALILTLCLTACGDDGGTAETTTGSTGDASEVTTKDPDTTPLPDAPTTTGPSATDTSTTDGPDDPTRPASGSTGHGSTMEEMSTAPPPSCDDGLLNQDETDADCGGAKCGPCADGLACAADEDCQVASCLLGVCAAPTCEDGLQNADETDTDCGGSCEPCGDNLVCVDAADCTSQICTAGTCTPASCGDAVQNGEETDLDCGGPVCDSCLGDATCIDDGDCLSDDCVAGLCADVGCQNDTDCDMLDSLCAEGHCKIPGFQCEALPKNNGMNCEGNELCVENSKCQAGVCGGGNPKDCSAMSDACHIGGCDVGTGECIADPVADGIKCEDGNACTKLETCKAGVCGGPLTALFTEDFSDDMAGWTLGAEWAIGPAMASMGCFDGSDPEMDHTPTDDNGVAGVVIGGCSSETAHNDYCLTSPVVDLSTAPADVHLSFWRFLISDYEPYMKNLVQVFNGNTWVTLFETGETEIIDVAWSFFTHDVSTHKNAKFQARWCFSVGDDDVYKVPSWSVDDVTIGPAACMQ